ncbi:MAG: HDOD domain-containing protein [Fibrobacteria bacterium]|nr:HDOD domain-containing protein [Fibrobacteria bacterium]
MDIYVARQPIFDAEQRVQAYELLFRSGLENFYPDIDGDIATSKVISNSFISIGFDELTKGKKAFINFTRKLIINGAATALPREAMTIEVLENIEPDEEVIEALTRLRKQGYTIALDDFILEDKFKPLIELADIIKIDFLASSKDERRDIVQKYKDRNIIFLAEKIENYEEFEEAKEIGYTLFQGYFFCKPEVIQGKDIPGYKVNYLELLKEINMPDIDFDKMEAVIKRDVSLSFKLLKLVNSVAFGFSSKIKSIKHALVMLGIMEIKKWLYLVALTEIGDDRPDELIVKSLVRAKFCEFLAVDLKMEKRKSDFFLLGLFSLIDVLMGQSMEEIIEDIPIADDVKAALMHEENEFKRVYEIVLSYEEGNWDRVEKATSQINISELQYPKYYLDSVEWANKIFAFN